MNTLNIVKPPEGTKAPVTAPSAAPNFASKSVPRHLARGVIGFGLIIGSIAMVPVAGPATLLAAPLALIAFRGCPDLLDGGPGADHLPGPSGASVRGRRLHPDQGGPGGEEGKLGPRLSGLLPGLISTLPQTVPEGGVTGPGGFGRPFA
ncbi:hypothetical protein STANM309S_04117 [Streptomyces tanashiensis]